jgi:short-subunit dehydrogenase
MALNWAVSVLALPGAELDRIADLGALVTSGDITLQEIRERAVKRTLQHHGRIDVLINSVGIGLYAPPTEIEIPAFSRIFDVNVLAPLALTQLVVPYMNNQGSGAIVNIGSVAGLVALPWAAAYSAAKFALHSMHDSLRRELRGTPIHVLKVCPGIVDTPFRHGVIRGEAPAAVKRIRWVVSPETVAARILWALEHRRHTLYVPRIGRVFTLAGAIVPSLMDLYLSRFLVDTPSVDSGTTDRKNEFAFNNTSIGPEE